MLGLLQESFKINLFFLHFCGVYPASRTLCYKIRGCLLYLLSVILLLVLSYLHLFLNFKNLKLEDLNYDAPFYVQVSCYFLKMTLLIKNGSRIKRSLEYMDAYNFSLITEKQKEILKEALRVCQRNTNAFLVFCMAGCVGFGTKPLFGKVRRLPCIVWLPPSFNTNLVLFYSAYFTMTIIVGITSFGTGSIDTLMAGLTHYATCYVKILNEHLINLDVKFAEDTHLNLSKSDRFHRKIVKLVEYHKAILHFVQEVESCFSWVFFSQIIGSVFLICFVCLQVAKVNTFDYTVIQLASYFVIVVGQVTFYCYYGNNLTKESGEITNSIYMSKWYDYDLKSRKYLIILMQRSQKPLTLTAGKIVDLSLVTLSMIVRRSYSLLAVLQNY